jgi:hypothetical protein
VSPAQGEEEIVFQYLKPKDGPVFDGLEQHEVVYAKDQPEYIPLRTLVSSGPKRKAISRWTLTPEQRAAIAAGADIFLELSTFGYPLHPIRMMVCDDNTNDGKPLDRDWIRVCLLDGSAWSPAAS